MTKSVEFKCSICDDTLNSMPVLRNHMESHKFLKTKLKKRYLKQDNNNQKPSKKHKKEVLDSAELPHLEPKLFETTTSSSGNSVLPDATSQIKRKQYLCTLCDKNLNSISHLRNHMRSHKPKRRCLRQNNNNRKPSKKHKKEVLQKIDPLELPHFEPKVPTTTSSNSRNEDGMNNSVLSNPKSQFICSLCDSNFNSMSFLRCHMRGHQANLKKRCISSESNNPKPSKKRKNLEKDKMEPLAQENNNSGTDSSNSEFTEKDNNIDKSPSLETLVEEKIYSAQLPKVTTTSSPVFEFQNFEYESEEDMISNDENIQNDASVCLN